MPDLTLSDNIFAKCLPALSTDIQKCGAVTLCNLSPTTADTLESIYKDDQDRWRIMGALIKADFTGKACQSVENGFYEFLRANAKAFGPGMQGRIPKKNGNVDIMPFIKMGRKGPINNIHWTVSGGSLTGGVAPNGGSYGYAATVTSQTGIPADENWFPDQLQVFIEGYTAGGSKTQSAWRVVDATVSGSNITLYLAELNTGAPLPASKKVPPTGDQTGILLRGLPNINSYEKYCAQIPALNTTQDAWFWVGETRTTFCDSELMTRFRNLLKESNPLYERFLHVEDVEVNRQVWTDHWNRIANAFFFSPPYPNQTPNDWDQLEEIDVFSDANYGDYTYTLPEGRCIGRRANPVGVYHQLAECGYVKDLQGQVLNIPELLETLYSIMRVREANGIPTKVIEVFTDDWFANLVGQAFINYYSAKYGGAVRFNIDLTAVNGNLGFRYRDIPLDYPSGVTLRLVTHRTFDDMVSARKNAGMTDTRDLWILEFASNYMGIIETFDTTNESGSAADLAKVNANYLCVGKVPKEKRKLHTMTWTVVSECPASNRILENIAPTVPEHEGKSGDYEDLYGAYTP